MTSSPAAGPSAWKLLSRAALLWVGTVLFIVGSVLATIGVQEARKEQTYHKQGLTIDALVLDKTIEQAKRGENSSTRYLVTYRFTTAQGETVEGSSEIPVEDWERLEAGQKFPVTYLPDAPASNRPHSEGDWIAIYVFLAIGGVFTVLGGGLAFSDLRAIVRTIRVSRHGLPTEGTIVSVGPTGTSINRVRQWRIRYRYRDHLGRTQESQSHLLSPDEAAAWREGNAGTVRFNRERPQDSVWIGKEP